MIPKPRKCYFYGTCMECHINNDGTWIEDESFAYPNDTFTRRAYVNCNGVKRVVLCKCADTFFSIPARARINRRYVKGFISGSDNLTMYARFT
jgi:hypothetical protein